MPLTIPTTESSPLGLATGLLRGLKPRKTPKQLVARALACLQALDAPVHEPWMAARPTSVPSAPPSLVPAGKTEKPRPWGVGGGRPLLRPVASAPALDNVGATTTTTSSSLGSSGCGNSTVGSTVSGHTSCESLGSIDGSGSGSSSATASPTSSEASASAREGFFGRSFVGKTISSISSSSGSYASSSSSFVSEGGGGGKGPQAALLAKLAKCLARMKELLYGDGGQAEPQAVKCRELARLAMEEGLVVELLKRFPYLPFEARKDAARIFSNFARHNWGGFAEVYLTSTRFDIIDQLIQGYDNPLVAYSCGTMLRDALRNEKVARRLLLRSDSVWPILDTHVHVRAFEVASDSFATLTDLVTRHEKLVAQFLDAEFDKFFARYRALLLSDNYVTKRQAIRLLDDVLTRRSNFHVMKRFVCEAENLKAVMLLMREAHRSPTLQYEAFTILRLFAVNPRKPPQVVRILLANRDKLVAFVKKLHRPRRGQGSSDEEVEEATKQFEEEKAMVADAIMGLAPQDAVVS